MTCVVFVVVNAIPGREQFVFVDWNPYLMELIDPVEVHLFGRMETKTVSWTVNNNLLRPTMCQALCYSLGNQKRGKGKIYSLSSRNSHSKEEDDMQTTCTNILHTG